MAEKKDIIVNESTDIVERYNIIMQPEIQELIETEGTDEIESPFDLSKVVNPQGKSKSWEYDTVDGTESTREVAGVILYHQKVRSYWAEEYTGEGNPPDCASLDGRVGIGNPGGDCRKCPLNQWGSAGGDDRGKACKEQRVVLILLPGEFIPRLMVVPPTSIKDSTKYFNMILSSGRSYSSMVTRVTAETKKSGSGFDYPHFVFTAGDKLPPEMTEQIKSMRAIAQSLIERMSVEQVAKTFSDDVMSDDVIKD